MFQNLVATANSPTVYRELGYAFLKRQEKAQALLCFDHYFLKFPAFLDISNDVLAGLLEDFLTYSQLFRDVIHTLDLSNEQHQRVFNFAPTSIENAYRLRTETWTIRQAMERKAMILDTDEEGIVVSASDLLHALKASLWSRLERRMCDENEVCQRKAKQFTPCVLFIMNTECRHIACQRQHIQYTDLTQQWFNSQLRIHFLQILIFQVFHSIPSAKNTMPARRYVPVF